MRNIETKELLERLAIDDIEAFEEIFNYYSKDMFFYAYSILKKKEICEDVVQNIFTDFWIKRKTLKINNLKAYLFKCVKYQILNKIRNQKISDEDLTRLNIVDVAMNASKKMESEELENLIEEQISQLPQRCRQIFILSRFEQKSNKEISVELGISVQAVKNQISKALSRIRRKLSAEEIVFYLLLGCQF